MDKQFFKYIDSLRGLSYIPSQLHFLFIFYKFLVDFKEEQNVSNHQHLLNDFVEEIDMEKFRNSDNKVQEMAKQLKSMNLAAIDSILNEDNLYSLNVQINKILEKIKYLDFSKNVARGHFAVIGQQFFQFYKYLVSINLKNVEMITSDSLIKILQLLVAVTPDETILDPFCGTGELLLRMADKSNKFQGQELNPEIYNIAKICMMIQNRNGELYLGDSFFKPQFAKSDVVVTSPPMGIRFSSNNYFPPFIAKWGNVSKSGGDIYNILLCLEYMKNRGAIVVPEGVLFRGSKEGTVRAQIIKENLIEAVVALPPGIIPGTGVQVSILFFNRNKKDDSIFFVDSREMFSKVRGGVEISEKKKLDLSSIFLFKEEQEGISRQVSMQEIEESDFVLSVNRYVYKEPEIFSYDIEKAEQNIAVLAKDIEQVRAEVDSLMAEL